MKAIVAVMLALWLAACPCAAQQGQNQAPRQPAQQDQSQTPSQPVQQEPDQAPSQPAQTGTGGETGAGVTVQQARNPLINFATLPFQYNANLDFGPNEVNRSVLNIQPLLPFEVSEDWNLIVRPIVPVVGQPEFAPGAGNAFGLGDTVLGLFLTPSKPRKWNWGYGPAALIPTATEKALGSGKWGAGATVIAVRIKGQWVYGGLAFQIWSIDNRNDRPAVNTLSLQPFVNYVIPEGKGWYVLWAPVITANWEASAGNVWTVPVGGGVGRVFKVGKQAMDINLQAYANVVRPEIGPEWQVRFVVTLLFPKSR